MNKHKKQDDTIRMSLRIPSDLHAELLRAAEYNGRFLNDEVIERIRATPVLEAIAAMARENAEMKAMLKEMHSLSTGK